MITGILRREYEKGAGMKVHEQYVIEIEEVIRGYMNKEEDPAHVTEPLAKIKGFNALVFDKNGLGKLKRVDEEFCIEYLQESGWMKRHDRAIGRRAWIFTGRKDGVDYLMCPNCTSVYTTRTNYCPHCGLDLR